MAASIMRVNPAAGLLACQENTRHAGAMTGKPGRSGRAAAPPELRRSARVVVRFTAAEYAIISAAAGNAVLPLAAYIRESALGRAVAA